MATIINDKKFMVVKATADEFLKAGYGASDQIVESVIPDGPLAGFTQYTVLGGQYLVCDFCNEEVEKEEDCYFVAVLNQILCEKCYQDWLKTAVYYPEDTRYEKQKLNSCLFNLAGAEITIQNHQTT